MAGRGRGMTIPAWMTDGSFKSNNEITLETKNDLNNSDGKFDTTISDTQNNINNNEINQTNNSLEKQRNKNRSRYIKIKKIKILFILLFLILFLC